MKSSDLLDHHQSHDIFKKLFIEANTFASSFLSKPEEVLNAFSSSNSTGRIIKSATENANANSNFHSQK